MKTKNKRGKFILPLFLTSSLLVNCATVSKFLEYREREFAIYDSLQESSMIKYVKDTNGDYWQTSAETKKRINSDGIMLGDCDDRAGYLHNSLLEKGIKAQMIYGKLNPSDKKNHVWVELYTGGELYILDIPSDLRYIYTKRKDINPSKYVHINNSDHALNKFEDYIRRSGLNGDDVNTHYNYLIKKRKKYLSGN